MMIRDSFTPATHFDALDLHRWENEGGAIGRAHQLRHGERNVKRPVVADRPQLEPERPPAAIVDKPSHRRIEPRHWGQTGCRFRTAPRPGWRWSPRMRGKGRSRFALETSPLGRFG